MHQSAIINGGVPIGLLRGAGTRMATFFYAMHRALRCHRALLATVHSPQWANITQNVRSTRAVIDINSPIIWKAMYYLLQSIFPALRALRYADSNKPAMDKIYYLVHRTTTAIERSVDDLNNEKLFPSLDADDEDDSSLSDSDASDDDYLEDDELEEEEYDDDEPGEEAAEEDTSLSGMILQAWIKRMKPVNSDFAITSWALCVMPEIREDVQARMKGAQRLAIERAVTKLYAHDVDADIPSILDTFWNEYKDFSNRTGCFSNPSRWTIPDAVDGKSHLWHKKYSLPYTSVLGNVACRTTSKVLGIGAAERSWGDVKHLKSNKRSHLGSDTTEKQAVIYTSARLQEERFQREER